MNAIHAKEVEWSEEDATASEQEDFPGHTPHTGPEGQPAGRMSGAGFEPFPG